MIDALLKADCLDANPGMALLLGQFMARWSLAETCLIAPALLALGLQDSYYDQSKSDEGVAAAMLASVNSTEAKIKIVEKMLSANINLNDTTVKLKASLKRLMKLAEFRNGLCHHLWVYDPAERKVFTMDHRQRPVYRERVTERTEPWMRALCNATVLTAADICENTPGIFFPWFSSDEADGLLLRESDPEPTRESSLAALGIKI